MQNVNIKLQMQKHKLATANLHDQEIQLSYMAVIHGCMALFVNNTSLKFKGSTV